MKAITILLLVVSLNSYSQSNGDTTYFSGIGDTIFNAYVPQKDLGNRIPYIVGSATIPGYKIETRDCPIEETILLPNGRRVAGLSCILRDKDNYLGGTLTFGQKSTIITDIVIIPEGDGARFIVRGKDFDMDLTLRNGLILELENDYSVLNTDGVGIWSIKKTT